MSATEGQIFPSRITAWRFAWIAPLLLFFAALVAPVASAKTLCVSQNRAGENFAAGIHLRPAQGSQTLELQRENSLGRYDSAVDDTLAAKNAGASRSLSERIADLQKNPENWEKVSASAEQATGKSARGGVSIESTYRNKVTGETLHVHDVYKPSGTQIPNHPTYRDYGKGG